jgi:D-proline reductase (dithiol) PrdB
MVVDSYKFLPRSFRTGYEQRNFLADEPVWTELARPVTDATVALLTSAGLYVRGEQPPFDVEREKQEPTWGDPSYRLIPRDIRQDQVGAAHLHINTHDVLEDFNISLPIRAFNQLEARGDIGALADEHYAVMGFQERGLEHWRIETAPEITRRLHDADISALVLAPA